MRQISNLEVRKIKRLNSKEDGQKIKTRTEIRVQSRRAAEGARSGGPEIAAPRRPPRKKTKGRSDVGHKKRPWPDEPAAQAPPPRPRRRPGRSPRQSGRPPSRASAAPRPLCTSRFQESGGFTAEPRSPREPEPPEASRRISSRCRSASQRLRPSEEEGTRDGR